jgi:hypothetical protein
VAALLESDAWREVQSAIDASPELLKQVEEMGEEERQAALALYLQLRDKPGPWLEALRAAAREVEDITRHPQA